MLWLLPFDTIAATAHASNHIICEYGAKKPLTQVEQEGQHPLTAHRAANFRRDLGAT